MNSNRILVIIFLILGPYMVLCQKEKAEGKPKKTIPKNETKNEPETGSKTESTKKTFKVAGYQVTALDVHNSYRKKHQVPALKLGSKIIEQAKKCAEYYAEKGAGDHSCPHKVIDPQRPEKYGENIYWSSGTDKSESDVMEKACKWWYSEVKDYDFERGGAKETNPGAEFRHFTQMVWKNTTELGNGVVKKGSWMFVVSLYNPMGNFRGKYKECVFQEK